MNVYKWFARDANTNRQLGTTVRKNKKQTHNSEKVQKLDRNIKEDTREIKKHKQKKIKVLD